MTKPTASVRSQVRDGESWSDKESSEVCKGVVSTGEPERVMLHVSAAGEVSISTGGGFLLDSPRNVFIECLFGISLSKENLSEVLDCGVLFRIQIGTLGLEVTFLGRGRACGSACEGSEQEGDNRSESHLGSHWSSEASSAYLCIRFPHRFKTAISWPAKVRGVSCMRVGMFAYWVARAKDD